jgi:hypothetical protein
MNLERRVIKIENKLFCKKNGIAEWALKAAEGEAFHRNFLYISLMRLQRAGLPGESGPHLFELRSKQEILNLARELSGKYSSLEDYELNKPKHTFSGNALNEIIQRYKDRSLNAS